MYSDTITDMIGLPDWAWAALAAPFAGSCMAVLARRLPAGRKVGMVRSVCDNCGATLGPRELVPLLSYAVQRGRCRHCNAPISQFEPAMELAAVTTALWAGTVSVGITLWISCLLGWMLLALAAADWNSYRLPDGLTLPLLLVGLGATAWLWPSDLADHALAAALAYLLFRGVALAYRRLRGRDGLGSGDAKLLAASGAWVGLAALPWVILAAALAGLALAAGLALHRRQLSARMALPFGPCLALATWLVWLYA